MWNDADGSKELMLSISAHILAACPKPCGLIKQAISKCLIMIINCQIVDCRVFKTAKKIGRFENERFSWNA